MQAYMPTTLLVWSALLFVIVCFSFVRDDQMGGVGPAGRRG